MKPVEVDKRKKKQSAMSLEEEKLKFKLEERTCETGTDFQKRMHNRKLMRGTMGLTQMREWKRTKDDAAIPNKRDLSSQQVDQFLRDKKLSLQRTECEMSKRRRLIEQIKADMVIKSKRPHDPVDMIIPKEKIRDIELQISYQDRFKLDEFYAFILSLDVYNLQSKENLQPIPEAFEDGLAYRQAFRPAFFHEVRANLEQCVRHADTSNPPKVTLQADHEANEFMYLICTHTQRSDLSTHFRQDEMMLCVLDNGERLPPRISPTTRFKSHYFLSISELESGDSKIKAASYIKTRITDELRALAKTPRTYYVIFLEYTKTMIREFRMINTANFLELPMIVNNKPPEAFPQPPKVVNVAKCVPPLNPLQVEAVTAAMAAKPEFTLIAGPPATGKTHILLCLLSLLLQRSDCPKPLLVCAPSEAAVDEIVARVLRDGIMGFNGNVRTDLKLIRVGNREKDLLEFKQRIPCERPETKGDALLMCLQTMVRQRMGDQGVVRDINRLDNLSKRLEQMQDQLSRTSESADPGQWHRLQTERRETITALNKEKSDRAMFENKKNTAEMEFLKFVDIVFTTMSNAASRCLERVKRRRPWNSLR